MIQHFIPEFTGTFILILLGTGVVANVLLTQTKGNSSGWMVITLGWAMAVFLGISASLALGGKGHLNPAFTIALSVAGEFETSALLPYLSGQFAGAIAASAVTYLAYKTHFDATEQADLKLAVFCNAPAISSTLWNLITEIVGTFVLVLSALLLSLPESRTGQLGALPVGLLVLAIGLSLGGPTGYAINPARDLGPRIAHALLPIKNKRDSNWAYSWIPVAGPLIGALIGVFIFEWLT
ncbi:MAG: aquaporin family protein [Chitinophagaceae bacterium]|nr:aquaporin family protein [Chitinophagaceae bacterium]